MTPEQIKEWATTMPKPQLAHPRFPDDFANADLVEIAESMGRALTHAIDSARDDLDRLMAVLHAVSTRLGTPDVVWPGSDVAGDPGQGGESGMPSRGA